MNQEFIARIEGHGNLTIDWRTNKVQLNIHEGERLFEGVLVGRTAEEMAWITPRICGICPVAHNLASLMAIEEALDIQPNQTTLQLRELLMAGQIIQSHTLHLFFLSLPDYLGIDRGTDLAKKNPKLFQRALALKEISDEIVHLIGGRNVHPTKTTLGGFHKIPSQQVLQKLLKKIERAEEAVQSTVELAADLDYPELKVNLDLVAQEGNFITAVSSVNIKGRKQSSVKNYKEDIEEEIRNYSTAKFAKYKGREILVGALARLAVYGNYDQKYQLDFTNPFHNNFSQALEIAYYFQKAKEIIEKLLKSKSEMEIISAQKNPPLKGIGFVEAPRGGLYHEVNLNKEKIITYANIITPTVQNLTSIEKSGQALINQSKNRTKKEIERLLVMLVRAYDPCITCSVH